MNAPIEGRCDHCRRTLPLFVYQLDHDGHIDPYGFTCTWCTRGEQPQLCVSCWSTERLREEDDPRLAEEAELWEGICATNERLHDRAQADRAAVDGIAAASGMSETT